MARKALRQADLAEAERETLVGLCQDIHCKATTQHCLHIYNMGCDALHFKRACCSLDFVRNHCDSAPVKPIWHIPYPKHILPQMSEHVATLGFVHNHCDSASVKPDWRIPCPKPILPQMSEAAEAFFAEAGRRTYVTPAAFLELLALLVALLGAQRLRQGQALQRFASGLAKLESSAGQVAGMQAQLRVRGTYPCGFLGVQGPIRPVPLSP